MATEARRRERLDRGVKVRTEGLYTVSSWREITYLLVPRLVFVVGLLILPLVMPNLYWQRVISIMGIFALLALSFDFLAHFLGLVCIGGAFMIGVGGYIAGVLNSSFGLSPALTIPIATLGGGLICTLLWYPCLPLRGIYFAIATFLYPLLMRSIIMALNLFGGTEGISPIARLPNIWVEVYLIIGAVILVSFALRRLVAEDIGLIFRSIRDNDQAVMASGINVPRQKAYALFIASAIGCFAGAYLAHLYGFIGISLFALDFSIFPIAATVMGGVGTLLGPVLGVIILVPVLEVLRGFGQLRVVFYCLILIGFILFKPEGLLRWGTRKYHQFEHWIRI